MRVPPDDLTEADLRKALTAWGITESGLRYLPVGFGDHHWLAGDRWFVTVADLARKIHFGPIMPMVEEALRHAMTTAAALPLDFVVAPVGQPMRLLGEHYAVSVFPWVDGVSGEFGDVLPKPERREVLRMLAELHATPPPESARLLKIMMPPFGEPMADIEFPWDGGPYAEPARVLLWEHYQDFRRCLARFVRAATTLVGEPVLTHGEPHAGNLLTGADRRWLVDWDTVGLTLPERDLWLVAQDEDDLAFYAELTGRRPDPAALAVYRRLWDLSDLAEFLAWFRSPHERTADLEQAWEGYTELLVRVCAPEND